MTITVTVDELRAHEKAVLAWAHKRSEFYARQLILATNHSMMTHAIAERGDAVAKMQAWETENPAPRLIPSV